MADSVNGTGAGGHPKRRAAQKATALAAGQLESSSEEEEPPRGKRVARGKGKASRGRVSVATGREQAVGKGRRAIQQQASLPDLAIPSKPRSRTNSLSQQVPSTTSTPRKKPAARASGSKLKVHEEAIVIHDSDSEADEGPSQLSSPKAGPSSQSLGKAGASTWKKSPLKSSGGGKKRQRVFSPATSENPSALTAAGDDGELTDVSMATATENDGFPQKPRLGHPPPLSSVRTESLRSILTDPESGPEYNFVAHGPHVWVKIDEEGQLTTVNPASKDVRTMWWPAKVKQHNPLHVSLFGEPPGPVTFTHTSMLSKSSVAILSLKTQDNVVRFNNGNFASWSITRPSEPLQSTSTPFSPRKRQKTVQSSLEDKFEEARLEMLKADQKDNDGFPSTLSQLLKTGEVELRSSPSPPPFNLSDEEEDEEDIWVPPSTYCGIYEIPGELVLSKAYRSREDRWPAKILEWIPPHKRGATEKFKVVFYDGTNKIVPASWVVSTADEEFETCKMGDTVGNYGLNDEEQDDFDDDISPSRSQNSPVSPLSTFNSFITFPADFIPELPIPPAPSTTSDLSSPQTSEHPSSSTSSPEAFDDLPLHLQLSHTIPVLEGGVGEEFVMT
ncbi:hypothetical protein C8Q75DRAFT_1473 [Abortiporus biennis]|nr:hypothetical protein C8Q75DRAFT_1473 [Abortiporus biennis]